MKTTKTNVLQFLLIVTGIFAISTPCLAASSDILITKSGSELDWADAHMDNNIVATYVSSSSPPSIKVYHADGSMYRSIPLTRDVMEIDSLEISDGRVYYAEYNPTEFGYWRNETVYEYDLGTDVKRVIYVTEGIQQRITRIAADGDHVVLRGGSNDQHLILHTLSTGTNQIIVTSRDSIHGLAIDGDRIMWGGSRIDREAGREIHVYSISSGRDYIIPESKSARTSGYGDISGDNVVWAMGSKDPDYINGVPVLGHSGYDIRLTNLTSGKTRSIDISDTAPIIDPFISGNTLAWLKAPNVDYNNSCRNVIRTYDIPTGKFTDIGSGICSLNGIDGDLLLRDQFWITSISGKIPVMTAPTTEPAVSPAAYPKQQDPTPAESPVETVVIILAVTVGAIGYAIQKKISGR